MADSKMVPREPTAEMIDAGPDDLTSDEKRRAWQAMYDAAPAQAEPHLANWLAPHFDNFRAPLAAPSPAAEDGLNLLLQAFGRHQVEICRPDAELAPPDYLLAAADAVRARIERDAQEIAELRANCDSWLNQANKRAEDYAKCAARFADERDAALRRAEALRTALRAVTENMDRAGGDRDGMPECPWCKSGPHGDEHSPDCELVAARAAIRAQGDDHE